MRKLILPAFILIVITATSGCKDENQSCSYNSNLNAAYNNTLAQDIFADVFLMIFQGGYDSALHVLGQKSINGAEVFYEVYDSILIKVYYSDWNIACPDGLVRRGEYSAHLKEPLTDSLSIANVNFSGFAVDNNIVMGDFTLQNLGTDNTGKIKFHLSSGEIKVHLADSTHNFIWNSQADIIWTGGDNTPQQFDDDVFLISSSTTGVSISGITYETNTVTPFETSSACKWLSGGDYEILTPGLEAAAGSVQFDGADTCSTTFDLHFGGFMFCQEFLKLYRP